MKIFGKGDATIGETNFTCNDIGKLFLKSSQDPHCARGVHIYIHNFLKCKFVDSWPLGASWDHSRRDHF
jgi:hypothetical protein